MHLRCISSLLSLDISNNQITAKIELEIADAVNPAPTIARVAINLINTSSIIITRIRITIINICS